MPLTDRQPLRDNLLWEIEGADMPTNLIDRPMTWMRWRLLIQLLAFVLITDGAVAYLGWAIWKTTVR
jgi:hypothetical protein